MVKAQYKILAVLALVITATSSILFFYLKGGGANLSLVKAEGRYFVLSNPTTRPDPPQDVQEVAGLIEDRSSKVSSYFAEVTVSPPGVYDKELCYVDGEGGRSRLELISHFGGVETRIVTITSNSTAYQYVPGCGAALRMELTPQEGGGGSSFGPSSRYMGLEEVGGEDCFKVWDSFMGAEVTYWFSEDTGLILRTESKYPLSDQIYTEDYSYSEINGTLDDELFMPPPGVEIKEAPIVGGENTVCVSVPILTEDQATLFISVETDPPGYLMDYELKPCTGANTVAEVRLNPIPEGETVELHWTAYILIKAKDYSSLPKEARVPQTLEPGLEVWRQPQPSIQSSAEEVIEAADRLDSGDGVWKTAEAVLGFMGDLKQRGGVQDALNTLRTGGGVCNGYAMLSCALLRARGVPARVLAVIPVGAKALMHYLVEFHLPGYGWVWLEPSFKKLPHQPTEDVVLGVHYPGDDGGMGGLEGAAYTTPDVSLLAYDPESSETGGLEAVRLKEFRADKERSMRAHSETAGLWEAYMLRVNGRPLDEKEEIFEGIERGLERVISGTLESYMGLIDDLKPLYGAP